MNFACQIEESIDEEKRRLGVDQVPIARDMLIDTARRRFRVNPKHGIQYLIDNAYFEHRGTPEEIAKFLFEVSG